MVPSTIKDNCALVGCHNVLYVYIAGIWGGGVCNIHIQHIMATH